MTDAQARTIANAAMCGIAVVAGYFLLRDPKMRRVALRAAKTALTTTVPAYLFKEVQQAWSQSSQPTAS